MSKSSVGFRCSYRLTTFVRYMLYAQIALAVVSMMAGYLEYEVLSDYQNGVYKSQEQAIADGEASDRRQGIIGIVYLIVFVASGFLILRWIHRANYNARQLGAENMKFTPGWSIGYYFIPILCLWKPCQAMKEIWKASKNPSDWESEGASGLLPLWWTLWLISNFLGQLSFRLSMRAEELHELMNINIIYQLSNALDIALALVFLTIVHRICNLQASHVEGGNNQLQPAPGSIG